MEFYEAWAEAEKQEKEAAAQKAASSSAPRKKRRLPEPVDCVPVTHDPYLVLEGTSKSSTFDEQKREEEESSSSDSDTSSTEDTSPADGAGQNLDTEKNIPSESKAIEEKVTETKFDEDVPLKATVMTERQDDVQRQMKKEEEVKEVGEVKSEIKSDVPEVLLENLTNALLFAEVERVKAAAATEAPVQGSHGKWGKPPGPVPEPAQAVAPLAPASAKCGAVPKSKPPWRENNVVSAEPIASAPAPPLPPPSDPPPADGSVRPRSPSQPPRDNRPRGPAGPQNEGYYYTFFSSRREYERLVRNQFRSRRGRNQRHP